MDANNKKPLFSKEDFDKGGNEKKISHFQKYWKQYLGVGIISACVAGAICFWPSGNVDVPPMTPPADSLTQAVDTTSVKEDSVNVNDSVKPVSITETPVVEEAKEEVNTPKEPEVKKVNEEKPKDNVIVSGDVKEEALSVIRGKYGNNPERRRLLKERYQEIQNKVNEMYRNGQVK